MHIILLTADGRSPTEIARTLFWSRTNIYAIVGRLIREGKAAFDDRMWRGPVPLVNVSAQKLIEELTEGRIYGRTTGSGSTPDPSPRFLRTSYEIMRTVMGRGHRSLMR